MVALASLCDCTKARELAFRELQDQSVQLEGFRDRGLEFVLCELELGVKGITAEGDISLIPWVTLSCCNGRPTERYRVPSRAAVNEESPEDLHSLAWPFLFCVPVSC